MRYQERIYIQNQNSAVRNRNFNNFNMSSDMCIFNSPLFNVSGATKIDCTGTTTGGTYIISATTQTIPLTFQFTANTQTFIDTQATFRYQIYKYNNEQNIFSGIPVYKSEIMSYSAFSATNTTSQYIASSGLTLDGEYLIKGFYQFSACTNFLRALGKNVDTINYTYGNEYGIYNDDLDYYFIAIKQADTPIFIDNGTNTPETNKLIQFTVLPDSNVQNIPVPSDSNGTFIMTLNGLVLANTLDYSVSGSVVTLNSPTAEEDIITFIYTSYGGPRLTSDNIDVSTAIASGATNGQGSNLVYFNTTTNKYEVYTSVEPSLGNDILIMLNGVTLANNIDYYQSLSNTKRIILEGDLLVGDIITIIYFPANGTINGLNTNNPIVSWKINEAPEKNNGFFSLEVSTGNTFNDFYYTGYTSYDTTSINYSHGFIASGTVGTQLYYRVKNQKNYETLCGNYVTTTAYSDIIPIFIQSNSINSY